MNIQRRSKKFLLISTTITIIALASVLTVSAAVLLGTISGGGVTVAGVATGTITYSNTADGIPDGWNSTLQVSSGAWYTKLSVDAGYHGPVTITWQLQSFATGSWANVGSSTVTTFSLSGSGDIVYATASGDNSGNRDWSQDATSQATYRVIATINSA
jgi:hypothetical protein